MKKFIAILEILFKLSFFWITVVFFFEYLCWISAHEVDILMHKSSSYMLIQQLRSSINVDDPRVYSQYVYFHLNLEDGSYIYYAITSDLWKYLLD